MSEHTPIPWTVDPNPPFNQFIILGPDGHEIAVLNNYREIHEAVGNLRLTVRAVNSHARLLVALERLVARYDGWLGDNDDLANPDDYGSKITAGQVRLARAAIAEAKEER